MKIKQKNSTFEEVMARPLPKHKKPKKMGRFFPWLINKLSDSELKKINFVCDSVDMDKIASGAPVLYLMNHSCFTDLMIASRLIYPKPYHIVCTSDGFVGKGFLMRKVGCIPTHKFVMDASLVKDMRYVAKELKESILMYPEASYSFDGTATPLPDSLGKMVKLLGIDVVMIKTEGAFHRDPLYNNLQVRNVDVSARMKLIIKSDDIEGLSVDKITDILKKEFSFDNFKWQQENHIKVTEEFRADFLNRVLYKCPCCKSEGATRGKGTYIKCEKCEKMYELTEDGFIQALDGATEFNHIPDWYAWQRTEVRKEINEGKYQLDIPVKIGMLMDESSLYFVGEGRLKHTPEGFHLTGCDGKLDYKQSVSASYSLYSDYYWYEIGDMICIGDMKYLYYCFPIDSGDVVAKTRIAAEELYKMRTA